MKKEKEEEKGGVGGVGVRTGLARISVIGPLQETVIRRFFYRTRLTVNAYVAGSNSQGRRDALSVKRACALPASLFTHSHHRWIVLPGAQICSIVLPGAQISLDCAPGSTNIAGLCSRKHKYCLIVLRECDREHKYC